jgi:antitoxin (DNA-binding transcriptional repressor) of toxin-antitoxin stability system
MKNRVVSATEFKTKCFACIDEVEQLGGFITIARRGRPAAVFGPATRTRGSRRATVGPGKARIVGDIVKADASGLWKCAPQVV